jgi:putative NIF3 family GTP cyclohydrolase 1 type 2
VGQKGKREEVAEWRLEVVCPDQRLAEVVTAMRRAHSYEEPAYDVYPLHRGAGGLGEGRLGMLEPAVTLGELAGRVKTGLGAGAVQVVGGREQQVRRVAIVCGAGGDLFADAVRASADVFLTGELRFHEVLAARALNVGLVLPGHYATERPAVEALARRLQQHWPQLHVWASRTEQDPLAWV